ncbi:ParB N-terminal domain-containing protein [Streptomyces sp. NRRL S-31]|uniref:ParB N-terminal domain-containing protein n=1 Tax=Streptomyces sp. NRRL S-31 TaxID=1463898 RepID=UPI0004C9DAEB|nr:ParB N-terminal domain-containing protein [Streptomyces sp. NRRL S-31]
MRLYRGQMPTRLLSDQHIRPTEYVRWADARRRFETRPKDRALVEELRRSIPREGLREPITLGVSDRHPDVYVADGHHRAVALMGSGVPTFPFHWYWIRDFGVHMETAPFPFHLLTNYSTEAAR